MEESEKLTALKKAYAEIILNTTKEAAVRIMESERKAMRFRQELLCVKEDSLRILMRLKQMLEAKNTDAAIMSASQQNKIEELDAQLHEAEDIVKDLREELREVHAELDRVKATQPQAELGEEMASVSDANILGSDGASKGSDGFSKEDSCKGYCCFPNPEFASIIRRYKEPKLHKNGCTQRIRACKGSSCSQKVRQEIWKRGVEGNQACVSLELSCSNGSRAVREDNGAVCFGANKSIRRKRKQATRKGKTFSIANGPNHVKDAQNPSCSKNSDDDDKIIMLLDIMSTEKTGDKCKGGFLESRSNEASGNHLDKGFTERTDSFVKLQDCHEGTENPGCSKKSPDEDKVFMQSGIANVEQLSNKFKGILEAEVEGCTGKPDGALSLTHCAAADCGKLEGSSVNLVLKALGQDDGVPSQSPDSKFLKYTFQRKRKRDISCSLDPNKSVEENNTKENMFEIDKCCGSLKSESLIFRTESSQDVGEGGKPANILIREEAAEVDIS
ncbi:hypothetical protein SAY86_006774 [Trapa natans]|uniref:Uncharacterized protein n=1 Tax=Trapa natans TaxID=22666 RepID=A0AAN7L523_TRANT|nr:hypothetical protein SAY86_006774 [Trapa natans]